MACNLSGQAYLKWLNNIRTNEYTHKQRMNCEHTTKHTIWMGYAYRIHGRQNIYWTNDSTIHVYFDE